MPSFIPIFSLKFNHSVIPGQVAIGLYDGVHACITCATAAGKIFVHNPLHMARGGGLDDLSFLNMDQEISALCTAQLDSSSMRDQLLVGTMSSLLCYNVQDNTDYFFRDMDDGVSALTAGKLSGLKKEPLALAGGASSVHGFTIDGSDSFWNVTGDDVTTMAVLEGELLVGSEDFELRRFYGETVVSEITQSAAPCALTPLGSTSFGYALKNGTVGVYAGEERLWKTKATGKVVALDAVDIDNDGIEELVVGWDSGRVEVRDDRSGRILFQNDMASSVAGLAHADYRLDGREELIVVATDGEVRGFLPQDAANLKGENLDNSVQESTLHSLSLRKQELLLELDHFKRQQRMVDEDASAAAASTSEVGSKRKDGDNTRKFLSRLTMGLSGRAPSHADDPAIEITSIEDRLQPTKSITNAQVSYKVTTVATSSQSDSANFQNNGSVSSNCAHLNIILTASSGLIIRAAVATADQILDGDESIIVHPSPSALSQTLSLPLPLTKDSAADVTIRVFLATSKSSSLLTVVKITVSLPQFALYEMVIDNADIHAQGWVNFELPSNMDGSRLITWISDVFYAPLDRLPATLDDLVMRSLRDGTPVRFVYNSSDNSLKLCTDSIELAGELIQSLGSAFRISVLATTCDFPSDLIALREALELVEQYNIVHRKLTGTLADCSNEVKHFVVRAEDSRLLGDINTMKRNYAQLYQLNQVLIGEYHKRASNHFELLASLKIVNQTIQKAGKLRIGEPKTHTITACRAAVKQSNAAGLIKAIRFGAS